MSVQESVQESPHDRLAMAAQGASAISASDVVDIGEQARLSARRRERLMSIGSPLGLLLAWEIAARFGSDRHPVLPGAQHDRRGDGADWRSPASCSSTSSSACSASSLGFLLGGIPAIIIGILMGISRPVRALVDPLIAATYPIPKSSLLPLILLIFGLGEMSKVVMVAIGVFFPIAINATAGVLQISPIYLDVGKSFKASRWDTFRTIALPGALPFIMTGIKLGAGLALILIAIAEMVGAKSGIGYMIWSAWETFAGRQDVCRAVRHRADRLCHQLRCSTKSSAGSSDGKRTLTAAASARAPAAARATKIRIQHLIKRFRTLVAVDDVSLDIAEGSFFAIVGPSGCGKTTLLRILGGLETVDQRRGRDRRSDARPAAIFHGLPGRLDLPLDDGVGQRRLWPAHAQRAEGAKSRTSVARWLDRTGLTRFAHLYPHQLSGGMRQRVSIARAFANDPEVLLMDEPFSALDEQNRTILQQELLRIWEVDKKTVVFITHSVDEAVTLADKIMVMTASPGRAKIDHRRRPRAPAQRARTAQRSALRRDRLRHLGPPQGRGRARAAIIIGAIRCATSFRLPCYSSLSCSRRQPAAQQRATVKMAVVPSIPSASAFLALDKGYFRDAGLDVTIERIDSLSKAVAFIATDQVQVGQGGISAGFFNAVAEGLPLTMTLEAGSTPLYHQILLRTDLKDKIKTPADLKGRTVGISSPGSAAVYEIGMVLDSVGLKLKDIDIKYIALHSDGTGARQRRARRGAAGRAFRRDRDRAEDGGRLDRSGGSHQATAADQRLLHRQFRLDQTKPRCRTQILCGAGARRPRLLPGLSSRPQPRRIRRSHDQGQDRHRPPVARAHGLAGARPNGTVNLASVASMQDFYKQEKIIDKTAPTGRLVDASFAEAAAKELGQFELINKASKLKGCR